MLHSAIGKVKQNEGEIYVTTGVGEAGYVVYGPYCVLEPGGYQVEFHAMPHELSDEWCCVVDVLRRGTGVTAEKDFTASELIHRNGLVRIRFEVIERDTFEFRLCSTGRAALTVRYKRPLWHLSGEPTP